MVVERAVQAQIQQVLPSVVTPGSPRKAKKKSKRPRVPSSEEEFKEELAPSKLRKVSSWLDSVGDDSLSHQSNSDKEDGELLEDEGRNLPSSSKVDRLCPIDLYHRVMGKAARVLDLPVSEATPQLVPPSSRAKTYPQGPQSLDLCPFRKLWIRC